MLLSVVRHLTACSMSFDRVSNNDSWMYSVEILSAIVNTKLSMSYEADDAVVVCRIWYDMAEKGLIG